MVNHYTLGNSGNGDLGSLGGSGLGGSGSLGGLLLCGGSVRRLGVGRLGGTGSRRLLGSVTGAAGRSIVVIARRKNNKRHDKRKNNCNSFLHGRYASFLRAVVNVCLFYHIFSALSTSC